MNAPLAKIHPGGQTYFQFSSSSRGFPFPCWGSDLLLVDFQEHHTDLPRWVVSLGTAHVWPIPPGFSNCAPTLVFCDVTETNDRCVTRSYRFLLPAPSLSFL
jgi:hypothetical protein